MNVDADTVPLTLKVAAIFLAASGEMALVAGVGGPHLCPSLGKRQVVELRPKFHRDDLFDCRLSGLFWKQSRHPACGESGGKCKTQRRAGALG
jgi:hypothetical protein